MKQVLTGFGTLSGYGVKKNPGKAGVFDFFNAILSLSKDDVENAIVK